MEVAKGILLLHKYDPESVAKAQGSSRPGKRKGADVWNVSSRSASTSSLLQRAQCVPVCIAQGLVGAFEDLKQAVDEHKHPAPLATIAPVAAASAKLSMATATTQAAADRTQRAELAAKDKSIKGKDIELQAKNAEVDLLMAQMEAKDMQLAQAASEKEKGMDAIIEGAKAQGACIHLHLHW